MYIMPGHAVCVLALMPILPLAHFHSLPACMPSDATY